MDQVIKANTLQTLHIYRKIEKTPSDLRIKRLEDELGEIR